MLLPDSTFPHRSWDDRVNSAVVQSEIEGGVALDELPRGAVLEVETQNRTYVVEYMGDGKAWLYGHPEFCPEPVLVSLHGSTFGGHMLKMRYIGRGMRMEFRHPELGVIWTSWVQDVRERDSQPSKRHELVHQAG